jgi:septal ring factor EnvC (AmiA/AmiB activator)
MNYLLILFIFHSLKQTQAESSQATAEIEANLQEENSYLKHQLSQTQAQLSQATAEIEAMRSSKFWKMRTLWFLIKRRLRFSIN